MNDYRALVRLFESVHPFDLPLKPEPVHQPAPCGVGVPVVVILSPHPDDECIMGALPRRLQRESGWRVVNVAVTLGSHPPRREERRDELFKACAFLQWECQVLGWSGVNPESRSSNPLAWQKWVVEMADILLEVKPSLLLFPHEKDGHPVHQGVHWLAMDALSELKKENRVWHLDICLTEYWHAMENPNRMECCHPEDLADLIAALSLHRGEVERNPYHLTLPAWMMDNVRRGSERIHGAGVAVERHPFAVLYRMESVF